MKVVKKYIVTFISCIILLIVLFISNILVSKAVAKELSQANNDPEICSKVIDTLPPQYTYINNCGYYIVDVTEIRNGNMGDNPRQVDGGIKSISLNNSQGSSYNYNLIKPSVLLPDSIYYEFIFYLKVNDSSHDAKATILITDNSNNETTFTVNYYAENLTLDVNEINFGSVRVNKIATQNVNLKNLTVHKDRINNIYLLKGEFYSINKGATPPVIDLDSLKSHQISITYSPKEESLSDNDWDEDSLIIETDCNRYAYLILGKGKQPKIFVEDWNAGAIIIGNMICKESQNSNGLRIKNPGTDTLTITDIINNKTKDKTFTPFSLSQPINPALPIIIPPNGYVDLTSVCFSSLDNQTHQIIAKFISDGVVIKDTSIWRGRGMTSEPYISDYSWLDKRVGTVNYDTVYIKNRGVSSVKVTNIRLVDNSTNFHVISAIPDAINSSIELFPETGNKEPKAIAVCIKYSPTDEIHNIDTVIADFSDSSDFVPGIIEGNGILPHLEITGWEFPTPISIGVTYSSLGYVKVKSTSKTADLYIDSIYWQSNPGDFKWVVAPLTKFILPKGEEKKFPVVFKSISYGDRIANVRIITDAAIGDSSVRIKNDTIVMGHTIYESIVNDSLDFGSISLCDEPIKTFKIYNTDSNNIATIDSANIILGNTENFEIIKGQFPLSILPGTSATINVKFIPGTFPQLYSAYLRIYSKADTLVHQAHLYALGKMIIFNLSMERHYMSESLEPGKIASMKVYITGKTSDWVEDKINEITVNIAYSSYWMAYQSVELSSLLNGWFLVKTPVETRYANGDSTLLSIHVRGGSNTIAQSGLILIPKFLLLLSDEIEYYPYIESVSFGENDFCTYSYNSGGYIILTGCEIFIRNVSCSGVDYELQSISPNPINSGETSIIKFSVGLEDITTLELYNSTGERITTLVNQDMKPGSYEAIVPIQKLPSGAYFVRMKSGPFIDLKHFIITK